MTNPRAVCLHGHFYQPPRENPWLEAIEMQLDAAPYHDWNERITDECYRTNAVSRVLDDAGLLSRVVNNYERISFNFGPTLMSWFDVASPETAAAIIEADRRSVERFGHGNAIAQCYNHLIMPLANNRDRRTQVLWGIADFEHRFGRKPDGMWLPESAVCTDSLEALAEHGIRFTIFAPRQAAAVRTIGDADWRDVNEHSIDPSQAYRVPLPSGKHIDVFFYDGPIAQAVAFEHMLNDGRNFAGRLLGAFDNGRHHPELVHVATDGETYGHHHRHGEMALSAALDHIEAQPDVKLTNYAAWLREHPPTMEARVHEDSSWSCVHGVERWRSDCGCKAHRHPGDHQRWREPLRLALDRLRDRLAGVYTAAAGALLKDPWAARDAYIRVILDRSEASIDAFLAEHATGELSTEDRVRALKLLELQRHAMLMYTSCGWFFDDIAGIETVQVILYAARAAQLASDITGDRFDRAFIADLEKAPGNRPEHPTGRHVYEKLVHPSILDLTDIAAHYAVDMIFREIPKVDDVYCFRAERLEHRRRRAGRSSMVLGRVRLTSRITLEARTMAYAVVHAGDHIIHGGAHPEPSDETWRALRQQLEDAFEQGDLAAIVSLMNDEFDGANHSLRSLLRDAQHQIAETVSASATEHAEHIYRDLHEQHQPLVRFLAGLGVPIPPALALAARFVLNRQLEQEMTREDPDIPIISDLLRQADREGVKIHQPTLIYNLQLMLTRVIRRAAEHPGEPARLEDLDGAVELARNAPGAIDLVSAQLAMHDLLEHLDPGTVPAEALERLRSAAARLRVKAPARLNPQHAPA